MIQNLLLMILGAKIFNKTFWVAFPLPLYVKVLATNFRIYSKLMLKLSFPLVSQACVVSPQKIQLSCFSFLRKLLCVTEMCQKWNKRKKIIQIQIHLFRNATGLRWTISMLSWLTQLPWKRSQYQRADTIESDFIRILRSAEVKLILEGAICF